MKKMFVITMCAAMLCATAGDVESVCGAVNAPVLAQQTTAEDSPLVISPGTDQDYIPGMPNPFIDCTTLKEAGSIAGFSMNAPKKIKGYGKQDISAIKNSLIQIIYGSGKKALYIRKAAGDSDISGDYNRYEEQKSVKIKGLQITLRGAKGRVNTAVWTNGDYSYSVFTQSAISSERIKKIIKDVIKHLIKMHSSQIFESDFDTSRRKCFDRRPIMCSVAIHDIQAYPFCSRHDFPYMPGYGGICRGICSRQDIY